MKSKLNILKCFLLIVMSAFLFTGCSLMDFLFPEEEVETYNFSGYVYADDMPLSEATVSCGLSEITTDERGYYSFSNLTKVVQVTVSKEGYYFDDTLVYIKSNRNDVNFDGYKFYNINGVVKNGTEPVANAQVLVKSKAGVHSKVTTNSNGNFYIANLAGEATITARYEDIEFFSQECNNQTSFVTINSAIDISSTILCDDVVNANDFRIKLNGNIADCQVNIEDNQLTFNLRNVAPHSVLTIESDSYFIENATRVINSEDRKIDFKCEKLYSVNVKTISGSTLLNDAEIFLNNNKITENRENGIVTINSLHGENVFSASLNGFDFTPIYANKDNTTINLVGTFNLPVNVITNNNSFDSIKIGVNGQVLDVTTSSVVFNEVELNSAFSVLTDNYYTENSTFEITSIDEITINLYRYYSLNLVVTYNNNPINNAKILLSGTNYSLQENGTLVIDNLYAEHDLEISLDGYMFDSVKVSLNNNNITAVAKKLFNIVGRVTSGDIVLSGASVTTLNKEVITNENGEFIIENVYGNGTLKICKENYNALEVNYIEDNQKLEINLTYNVTGRIVCGEKVLSGVLVTGGETSVETSVDGTFILENLQGNVEIVLEKDYYNFTFPKVSKKEDLIIYSTYYVEGTATKTADNGDDVVSIPNLKIILSNIANGSQEITYTNEQGKYKFTGLTGNYILIYDEIDYKLKPNSHDIVEGGTYDFTNRGYGFGGRVMCGSIGVSGVRINAGDLIVYTNEQGYYSFALITKETTLNLYKEGYTFNNNGYDVSDKLDGSTNVNFTCSYLVSGNVSSLVTPLENVEVTINGITAKTDSDGNYVISGIEGSGTIVISKLGYTFMGETQVTTATTNNFKAYYTEILVVSTGDIVVENVELIVNGKTYISDKNGIITIDNVEIGTNYTLLKQGYNFTNSLFTGFTKEEKTISCSYNISGIVYSGTQPVAGVKVVINGNDEVYTDSNGLYEFTNLIGRNVLSFSLENFQFEDCEVTEPTTLENYAKYSVSGYVKEGNNGLSGVIITAGKFETTTNGNGYFIINGLTTKVSLVLYKEGYEFEGETEVNSPIELQFSATYKVCGYVTSGEEGVEGVLVTSSIGGIGVRTDINGYYEIKGQVGIITLTYEKEGYETKTSQSNGYSNSQNINLTYSVIINFEGDDFNGIYISVNGNRKVYSSSSVTLNNLEGFNKLIFSKTGYSLTPSEYGVNGYEIINVTLVRYYNATFNVQTDTGLKVNDVIIQVGTKQAVLDANGTYIATELSNKLNVYADLIVESANGEIIYSKRVAGPTIEDEGIYNITISNDDYAYFMFVRAYQRLRDVYAYRVTVKGTVSPKVGGNQDVTMVYKKVDSLRLYENLNYGNEIMGVDPKVSLLTYTDLANKKVKYQMVNGGSVKNGYANYSTNWTDASYQDYQSTYGISPEGFFPYNITNATIGYASISKLTYSNDTYKFTMKFGNGESSPVNDLVVSNYRTLMNKMVSKQKTGAYHFVELTFTFNSNGDILSMVTSEAYTVTSMSVSVTTTGAMTYTYSTSNYDASISQIDISSNDAIRRTINETLPQNTKNAIASINICTTIKRREEVC